MEYANHKNTECILNGNGPIGRTPVQGDLNLVT